MAGKKIDAVQMEARVAEVVDLIIAGLTVRELHRYIVDKRPDWDIQARQRRNIIAKARGQIAEASRTHRPEELGKALRRYNVLYRRSFAINDYKACAGIVKQMTDLLGLGAPQRHEHTGRDGGPIEHVNESDLDREIRSLLGEMAAREKGAAARSPADTAGEVGVDTAHADTEAEPVPGADL